MAILAVYRSHGINGIEMNQTELDRRIKELRRENPAFAETMTDFKQVIGTTRQIGHIPPGYRDMQPGYRSDLLLIVRQVSRVFELDPLPTPVHKNWW